VKLKEQIVKHHMQLNAATEGMKQAHLQGSLDPSEVQQAAPQMNQLEQQEQLMAQHIQQLEKDWPEVSTVPVREDKSENHAVEASAVYDWMNDPEGRRYEHGTNEEQEIFKNFYLHWKKHVEVDAKLNPPQSQLKNTGESISVPVDKMPPEVAVQALAKVGINATADMFKAKTDDDTKQTIKQRTAPKVISKLTRS
jgi:hypothetical protein